MKPPAGLIVLVLLLSGPLLAQDLGALGLSPATPPASGTATVLLVHGYDPTPGEFDPLVENLEGRGFAVYQFHYDHTRRLDRSADQLARALEALGSACAPTGLIVIAHSMGGLVSRRAMTAGREPTVADRFPIRLVTVASPFAGFSSANWTAIWPWNIFGVKACHRDLGTRSRFIRRPGQLGANVDHVWVITREEGQRRRHGGRRVDDDTVPLASQRSRRVGEDPQLTATIEVARGHVGVLNDAGAVSPELIAVLDEYVGVRGPLGPVLPERLRPSHGEADTGIIQRLGD